MKHLETYYYTGKEIPCMAFDSQLDADRFDEEFNDFYTNKAKIKEFWDSLKYPSIKAIYYHLRAGNANEMIPDELLEVTENCIYLVGLGESYDYEDIYRPVVEILLQKVLEK